MNKLTRASVRIEPTALLVMRGRSIIGIAEKYGSRWQWTLEDYTEGSGIRTTREAAIRAVIAAENKRRERA